MNDERDLLNYTRFLIEGLKDYTDARVDEAAEEAVRRVIKKSIKNWLKMAGLTEGIRRRPGPSSGTAPTPGA